MEPMVSSRQDANRRLVAVVIVLLGAVTVGGALYFAAIDRPLITAAVGLIGALPLAFLAFALVKVAPPADEAERQRRRRNTARAIAATGAIVTVAGVILLATPMGTLGGVLLYTGPGFLIGGIIAHRIVTGPALAGSA